MAKAAASYMIRPWVLGAECFDAFAVGGRLRWALRPARYFRLDAEEVRQTPPVVRRLYYRTYGAEGSPWVPCWMRWLYLWTHGYITFWGARRADAAPPAER